jgi:hypothetical protein
VVCVEKGYFHIMLSHLTPHIMRQHMYNHTPRVVLPTALHCAALHTPNLNITYLILHCSSSVAIFPPLSLALPLSIPTENFTFISSYAQDGTGQVGVYERFTPKEGRESIDREGEGENRIEREVRIRQ